MSTAQLIEDTEPVDDGQPWLCGCLRSSEVIALAPDSLTYRQLNRWTVELQYLTAHRHSYNGEHIKGDVYGSGVPFGWPQSEAARAARAARLVAAVTPDRHIRRTHSMPIEVALPLVDRGLIVNLDGQPYLLALIPMPFPEPQ